MSTSQLHRMLCAAFSIHFSAMKLLLSFEIKKPIGSKGWFPSQNCAKIHVYSYVILKNFTRVIPRTPIKKMEGKGREWEWEKGGNRGGTKRLGGGGKEHWTGEVRFTNLYGDGRFCLYVYHTKNCTSWNAPLTARLLYERSYTAVCATCKMLCHLRFTLRIPGLGSKHFWGSIMKH